jgi:hypothetical protein
MFIKKLKTKLNLQSNSANSNENRPINLSRNVKALCLVLTLLLMVFANSEASAQTGQQAPPLPKIIQENNRRNQNPLGQNPNSMARYARDKYNRLWYYDGTRWYLWTTRGWRRYQ